LLAVSARGLLRWRGWQISGHFPDLPKFVLIGAPHTSNWDFPLTLGICFALRAKIYWMGKDSLFRGPLGPVMRWLGGIPVTRSRSTSLVQQMVEVYQRHDELVVAIAPEGTRGHVTEWKTGFYHIAYGAGVPVVLGFLDYRRKTGGIGPVFYPSGDLERDLAEIRAFYDGIVGRYPRHE